MLKRSRKYCSVLTCVNYYNLLGERCFSFPRKKKTAQDWVRAINNPTLNVEDAHTYHRTQGVCQRHFATHQFTTPARVRLNRGVVPTLFLPSPDNCENGLSASEIQKTFLSSARKGTIYRFAEPVVQADYQLGGANVKEDTDIGACEEAGSQLLPHLDSRMHSHEYDNHGDLPLPQKDQERAENPGEENSHSVDVIFTESSRTEHDISNGNQTHLHNICREPTADVGDTAVDGKELSEICDTESLQGNTDECEGINLIQNESYVVATETWENLPNQVCRLCASISEHPKQSIVGWLGMLNEIIPELVAVNDGLPQHVCRPCTNKLYTCNKIKADFIEAYKKLQECFGFALSPGIQFLHLPGTVSNYQTFNEVTEEQLVSEVEEQLVLEDDDELESEAEEQSVSQIVKPSLSDVEVKLVSQFEENLMPEAEEHLISVVPSDVSYGVLKTSNKDLLKGKDVTLNSIDKLSVKVQESVLSCTDEAVIHENFTQHKPEPAGNTSNAYDIKVQKVERRKKKYKYVCGECEEMFTVKGALSKHKRTHSGMMLKCDHCTKQCSSITQLNDHRRIHTKELPFMCEICGKCFRTAVNLSNHKYIHKPPIYTCEVCNKKCSSRFYLAQHRKVHSTDTKLICEVCGKIIYTPFNLKIHMRTHTGEKPFQCATCGRCFISAARLRTHRLVHTDRKFRCVTCGKEYYFKSSLLKHQECHNTLGEYRCPICLQLFANSDNMRRHGKVYCKHPLCTFCGQTLLIDEVEEEEDQTMEYELEEEAVAARSHIKQYLKCCPVCSQAIHGSGSMLKHMKECHKDYGYKPFACERCVKSLSNAGVLRVHRT